MRLSAGRQWAKNSGESAGFLTLWPTKKRTDSPPKACRYRAATAPLSESDKAGSVRAIRPSCTIHSSSDGSASNGTHGSHLPPALGLVDLDARVADLEARVAALEAALRETPRETRRETETRETAESHETGETQSQSHDDQPWPDHATRAGEA